MSDTRETWEVVDRHFEPRYVVRPDSPGPGWESKGWTGVCQPDKAEYCHLISAAPELLDALKLAREIVMSVRYQWKHVQPHLDTIDAAISKATGGAK